jgi:hypothetical protein
MLQQSGIPLDDFSGSGATKQLEQTVIESNKITEKQTRAIIRLTWSLNVFTVILVILTVILVLRIK